MSSPEKFARGILTVALVVLARVALALAVIVALVLALL